MPCLAYTPLLALLTTLLVLGGCSDTALDPFQESPFNYSIFGYLDAGADTQFVRVTPLRNILTSAADSIDATVTLEHLATAHKIIWKDSLFQFGQGVVGHNFWSTEPLMPGNVYRLTVMRSDGAASMATVTLPDTFPDPIIRIDNFNPAIKPTILITGVERLADVQMIYHVRDPRIAPSIAKVERFMFSYLQVVPMRMRKNRLKKKMDSRAKLHLMCVILRQTGRLSLPKMLPKEHQTFYLFFTMILDWVHGRLMAEKSICPPLID